MRATPRTSCCGRLARAVLAFALLVTCAAGQASIPIGQDLVLSGGQNKIAPIVLTPDGQWIYATSTESFGCATWIAQDLTRIRPDGTGREVLIDYATMAALSPGSNAIRVMRVSGDARRVYFTSAAITGGVACKWGSPSMNFLLDTETGVVEEFKPDGKLGHDVTWSDDGQLMTFRDVIGAPTPAKYYVAGPDGTSATQFLDVSGWAITSGAISGDGRRFLLVGRYGATINYDVLVYTFASQQLATVTPAPVADLDTASFSGDGSRVVYGLKTGDVYAVNADGSGHRLLVAADPSPQATLSRNGEFVFLRKDFRGKRISWDGNSEEEIYGGWYLGSKHTWEKVGAAAIDAEGTTAVYWGNDVPGFGPADPMTVWHQDTPVLSTHGFGAPSTDLIWEVGGEQGSQFLVLWSLFRRETDLGPLGLLELDPDRLGVIGSGTVTSSSNTGSVSLGLPPSLVVPADLTIYSQALYLDAVSGEASLTNATAFTVPGT